MVIHEILPRREFVIQNRQGTSFKMVNQTCRSNLSDSGYLFNNSGRDGRKCSIISTSIESRLNYER